MDKRQKIALILLPILAIAIIVGGKLISDKGDKTSAGTYTDGIYTGEGQGFGGPIKVEVEVSGGKITSIEILEHSETQGIGDVGLEEVKERIINEQKLDVDVSTGATMSSNGLMEAVKNALEGATTSFTDGEYEGEGQGFGGPIKVKVVVEGGKITSIEILDHSETPGIGDVGLEEVKDRIIEEQKLDVDVSTGATMSSNGLMDAVKNALEGATGGEGEQSYTDGEYEGEGQGFGGPIKVKVVIKDGKIDSVKILSHSETPGVSDPAIKEIPDAIVEAQSTDVDNASGATLSSKGIKEAVNNALALASGTEPTGDEDEDVGAGTAGLKDGTYEGSGKGFGGDIKVKVEVKDGKITSVKVLSHSETPGISDKAIKDMPSKIVKAQGTNVDNVSGATGTSKGIKAAVDNALKAAGGTGGSSSTSGGGSTGGTSTKPPAPVTGLKDGTYEGTGKGFGGSIKVKVEVKGGKITSVKVLSHSETPGISDNAIKNIPSAIVKAQSADVDNVSGATGTSKGIKEAVKNALKSAGGSTSGGDTTPPKDDDKKPTPPPAPVTGLKDGTYEATGKGFKSTIKVQVVIKDGKISTVKVLEHGDTAGIADRAVNELPGAIVKAQSAKVDTVSGATATSKGIIEAVNKALADAGGSSSGGDKDEDKKPPTPVTGLKDGTYEATGKGFKSTIKVEVVVKDGKISSIKVLEHGDTAGIADRAVNELPGAIIKAQSVDVDVVSGATGTSNGIKEAVNNAIVAAGGSSTSIPPADSSSGGGGGEQKRTQGGGSQGSGGGGKGSAGKGKK